MSAWLILFLVLLAAVIIGCIAGVLIGKHQVKRETSSPVLSFRQRIVFLSCILLGIGCILGGNYLDRRSASPDMVMEGLKDVPGTQESAVVDNGGMTVDGGGIVVYQEAEDGTEIDGGDESIGENTDEPAAEIA